VGAQIGAWDTTAFSLLIGTLLGGSGLWDSYTACSANLHYREETSALRKADQFACHCNASAGWWHLYLGKWSGRCLGWEGLTKTVIAFFKLLLQKSCWTFPFRMGASLSLCLFMPVQTAVVPQLRKSASHTHFLVNYMEEQWIIHPPALMSHFHNWFPSFWDLAWHLSGLPD